MCGMGTPASMMPSEFALDRRYNRHPEITAYDTSTYWFSKRWQWGGYT